MAETALNFGPVWLRALAHESTQPATSIPPPHSAAGETIPSSQSEAATLPDSPPVPRYSLAQYRYGREEMLALIPKDPEKPECLKRDTSKVVRDTFVLPLALTPVTEDEQRLWSRSVNSDAVLRASGKSVPASRGGGRGGSVDRGRGRGRGGYYQRGIVYEDSEDVPPGSFARPKPIERSQSANEKDQRWEDRERRFERSYSGRGGGLDDSVPKSEQSRNSQEHWRKYDKDDDNDWRTAGHRSSEKIGARGSWRNPIEKERRDIERNPSSRSLNGNPRGSQSNQKISGNHLPEWSVEESDEQDVVGTFDSSGAFLENKMTDNSSDDIYVSDDADEGLLKDSPEAKKDNSKKTQKKSSLQSQVNVPIKQSVAKQTDSPKKDEESAMDKHSLKNSEPHSKTLTNVAANKSADHVIKPNNSVQHHNVNNQNPDYMPVTLPNVPEVAAKCIKNGNVIPKHRKVSEVPVPSAAIEEDAFAHHKKATENMVAQWTEEEEQRVISQSAPPVHEKDTKWFYQDPQGEIQGPFNSPEMLEWFSAGYFTMSLMVRRSCDEKYSQLGELIKSWGRVPFMPGNSPPPIRGTPMTSSSLPSPVTQTVVPNPVPTPVASQIPKQDEHLLAIQQQLLQQQLMQQQLMLRQAQLQQILSQLKQQDNFANLNSQQQQQILMQQFMAQQQMPRPNLTGVTEQPNLVDTMTPLPLPLLGLPMAPLLKNDISLWNMTPSNPWPMNVAVSQPSTGGVWDVDPSKQASEESELEKQKRLAEEQEKLRKSEEERIAQEKEMEEKRKLEELRRKQEEERLRELQKQEEERKRLEEQKRIEEEKRRQEELRRLEEQKRKEEEQRKQEELKKIEEQKRLEELKKQEELKRLEELQRKEEERRQEELRRQEEQKKLEEKRKKEELQKKIEMERERERIELEKQMEAARLKEIEREQQLQRERQKQREKEEEMKRLAEIKLKSQGPAWGIQKSYSESQLSLADIQRLQEEKEREEREEKERIRQQMLQQQAVKQAQQTKNGLSWAKSFLSRSVDIQPAVKSLAEIQHEEAERLAEQQRNQKPPAPVPVNNSNVGVWGNASHLNRITAAPPSWSMNNVASSGFWDDALNSTQPKKQPAKTNDSAFPALSNPEKPATIVHSNKSKNVRAKKDEDVIKKLFGNRKPTDEFTAWCTEALSTMPSSVDVPTFVAFLTDIESPYEVHDYVKSYLGDGKEPREFAKQFLERRSKFRAKQTAANEDNSLWGPAPAITPVVNKTISQPVNDSDGNSNSKGKSKRRKNRMQKLDSSMLGFTVQSNPDRLNVGEIDHIEM